MANSITLAKAYADIIDEIYQREAVSAVLNSDWGIARAGASANEVLVPKVTVTGLGDYSRSAGYKTGSVTITWETLRYGYDRGIKLLVDAVDNTESGIQDAFTVAQRELQRTQVAPEADAYTFATLAASATDLVSAGVTYSTGESVLQAISGAMAAMDEAQVPTETRHLFITPTLKRMVDLYNAANGTTSDAVMATFKGVHEVPQARFYTAITLNDGTSSFGYAKTTGASGGKDLNFMIVEESAVVKYDKHVASAVFAPDSLEDYDAWMQKYRKYGIVHVFENKAAGVAMSHKAS